MPREYATPVGDRRQFDPASQQLGDQQRDGRRESRFGEARGQQEPAETGGAGLREIERVRPVADELQRTAGQESMYRTG
jgi:hypothetical protein